MVLGIGEPDYKPSGPPVHRNPYEDIERNRIPGADSEIDHLRNLQDLGMQDAYGRVAPQAAGVQLGYVPPATPSAAVTPQLNYGAMAPGLGVTAGALGDAAGTRMLQMGNLGLLGAAATGAVPSAAEMQLQRGLDAGLRQNLALAASASGTAANQAAGRRGAINANTSALLQTGGQTAQLRAQEQALAREQLTNALGGIRQQDYTGAGVGTTLTGLGLDAAKTQLGADKDVALANLSAEVQTKLANLQVDSTGKIAQLDADKAVTLANLDAQLKQRGMDDQTRLAYMANLIGIDMKTAEGQIRMYELYDQALARYQAIKAGMANQAAAGDAAVTGAFVGGTGTVGAAVAGGGGGG